MLQDDDCRMGKPKMQRKDAGQVVDPSMNKKGYKMQPPKVKWNNEEGEEKATLDVQIMQEQPLIVKDHRGRVVDSMSGLTTKEKNDIPVDIQNISNSGSEDMATTPGKDANKKSVHCQSSNKFSVPQKIDNDEAIQLNESDDDVKDGLGIIEKQQPLVNIEIEADLRKKVAIGEVQREENNSVKTDGELHMEDELNQSNQCKQLVVFEVVIEESVREYIRKEGDPNEGLLTVTEAALRNK
ncbi:OLC1v1036353C1 [Oldenlandia corymbosa var. corymbosa]|uniref:OLC1v1036353C1 n=1 Tax=Oldenlandia corymbosa var. corymbosa TaxID=529605 RepID=A0AAV1CWC5_OLDCO|nr:OLC1v1036353C1 [Oldenlandia corymbosa var. corymbosa]